MRRLPTFFTGLLSVFCRGFNHVAGSRGLPQMSWGVCVVFAFLLAADTLQAGEADLAIPDLRAALHDRRADHQRLEPAVRRGLGHLRHAGHQPVSAHADQEAAGPQVDARRRRDHLPDLQDLPDSAGQVPADAVRDHRRAR